MKKPDIRDQSFEELTAYVKSLGDAPFRASQIFEWIYQKQVQDFDRMTNLSTAFKAKLKKEFTFSNQTVLKRQVSSDGTTKVLFELFDREKVETVLIPTSTRATVCISTQAGCPLRCQFCELGEEKFGRNLTADEITEQFALLCWAVQQSWLNPGSVVSSNHSRARSILPNVR